jgi:hypothetical protein
MQSHRHSFGILAALIIPFWLSLPQRGAYAAPLPFRMLPCGETYYFTSNVFHTVQDLRELGYDKLPWSFDLSKFQGIYDAVAVSCIRSNERQMHGSSDERKCKEAGGFMSLRWLSDSEGGDNSGLLLSPDDTYALSCISEFVCDCSPGLKEAGSGDQGDGDILSPIQKLGGD